MLPDIRTYRNKNENYKSHKNKNSWFDEDWVSFTFKTNYQNEANDINLKVSA